MEIIKGKIWGAKKVVIYGPEGIGKSTFASHFPEPIFIDTEGSTKEIDVARFKKPISWIMLLEQIQYVCEHPECCKTLVIDTIDWAEQMCIEAICAKHHKDGLESFGYGNGYVYVKEEFGRFLNRLEDVIEAGINVVLAAHAQIRKFEQPNEMGAYDRYELKLGKKTSSQTSPLVKEWADMLLFANYKIYSVAADDQGKKHKAQGGSRVVYTSHHPCWDAKNRYGLPEEIPMDYDVIRPIIEGEGPVKQPAKRTPVKDITSKPAQKVEGRPEEHKESPKEPEELPFDQAIGDITPEDLKVPEKKDFDISPGIPVPLADLMRANNVTEWDIQAVCARRGYYTEDTPIENYETDFINGCLIAAWPKVFEMIKEYRKEFDVPFQGE